MCSVRHRFRVWSGVHQLGTLVFMTGGTNDRATEIRGYSGSATTLPSQAIRDDASAAIELGALPTSRETRGQSRAGDWCGLWHRAGCGARLRARGSERCRAVQPKRRRRDDHEADARAARRALSTDQSRRARRCCVPHGSRANGGCVRGAGYPRQQRRVSKSPKRLPRDHRRATRADVSNQHFRLLLHGEGCTATPQSGQRDCQQRQHRRSGRQPDSGGLLRDQRRDSRLHESLGAESSR